MNFRQQKKVLEILVSFTWIIHNVGNWFLLPSFLLNVDIFKKKTVAFIFLVKKRKYRFYMQTHILSLSLLLPLSLPLLFLSLSHTHSPSLTHTNIHTHWQGERQRGDKEWVKDVRKDLNSYKSRGEPSRNM